MSKRFSETTRWDDPWFRRLPPKIKCLWEYLCSRCDQAGVLDPDWEMMSFQIGCTIKIEDLAPLEHRTVIMDNGKILIPGFIKFQYGKLSPDCKPHAPVYAALQKHKLSPDNMDQNEGFIEKVDSRMRDRIIERDGLVCVYYNTPITFEEADIDHVIPRALGGRAIIENLVVSSKKANSLKGFKSLQEFCNLQDLDFELVSQRIFERISKPIIGYSKGFKSLQEEEKDKRKESDKEKEEIQLPFDSETFRAIWEEFKSDRKDRGAVMTHRAQKMMLAGLKEFSEAACIWAFQEAIKAGWKSVHPEKFGKNNGYSMPSNGRLNLGGDQPENAAESWKQ